MKTEMIYGAGVKACSFGSKYPSVASFTISAQRIIEAAEGSRPIKKAAPAHFKQGCRILTALRFFYDSFMTLFCTGYGCTSGGNTFPVLHLLPAHPGWLQKYAGGIIKSAHILFLPQSPQKHVLPL